MPGLKEARHRNVAGQLVSKIGLPRINGIVRRAIHPAVLILRFSYCSISKVKGTDVRKKNAQYYLFQQEKQYS